MYQLLSFRGNDYNRVVNSYYDEMIIQLNLFYGDLLRFIDILVIHVWILLGLTK